MLLAFALYRKSKEVEEYCKKLIDTVGEGGGFIMDGAVNVIPDEVKPENMKAMTELTETIRIRKINK